MTEGSVKHPITAGIVSGSDIEVIRENANLNGDSFSGKSSKVGAEHLKAYAMDDVMPAELAEAVREGYVYVHDLDQYALGTTNCLFIPFDRLLARGFNTGNGFVRPPKRISSAMSLVAIIFQAQQNAQYGGVSGNKIDWDLAPYVEMSFREHYRKEEAHAIRRGTVFAATLDSDIFFGSTYLRGKHPETYDIAYAETVAETQQAAEALIHNLNTMSSRAGGQIPFTSINYGMCTSAAGRLVAHALLDATIRGLGNGETPIFPQQIFQCKRGVNQAEGDANYDLFVKAVECSSKRLYPNFVNVDASFNIPHYREDDPDTFAATMGCRTRVLTDRHGRAHLSGRGNLSFNTVNLARLGIEYGIALGERTEPDLCGFFAELERYMDVAIRGLLHRYEIQCRQPARASDFMMREGAWEDGEKLRPDEEVRELLRHGTLAPGFIGLAECLKALTGAHHGESAESYALGRSIIEFMRAICDEAADRYDANISLFSVPAEGLSGKFTKMDRSKFGTVVGVTDREYYTNSFHIPVYYAIPAHKKIELEAPFHALCNAGAISYVELDGNMRSNPVAFRKIVQYALSKDIGYFSINHPLDRCPECGYEGVIGAECPICGATEETTHFYRLRRVTGYLTGDYTRRFNPAKQAEVRDRVRHGIGDTAE